MELSARFWAKVDKDGPVHPELGQCWLWTGRPSSQGYGRFVIEKRVHYAHRVSYELVVGPIPDGLELDHLCRVTMCVKPKHLEPVTHLENIRRGAGGRLITNCPQGHAYDETNTAYNRDGSRYCKQCNRERVRAYKKATYVAIPPKTHCKQGHEFTEENTWWRTPTSRACRACKRERERQRRLRVISGPGGASDRQRASANDV